MAYCEVLEEGLAPIATEVLGGGRRLADALGTPLNAVLIGSGISGLAKEAGAYGADTVYVVDDAVFTDYQSEAYLAAMAKAVSVAKPQVILMGQTTIGRDLAPRLAFRLETAATLDCVDLAMENGRLLQTKPVYGGNALAVYTTETDPQIVTVRVKSMEPLDRDDSRPVEVVAIDFSIDPGMLRTKVVDRVMEEVEGVKLEDATIIISGGRGIGSGDNFKSLYELAGLVKGAVGASRPPCDNGWVPAGLQIGLTGKVVAPDVYIAIGMSGASQHMSGCSGAKTIVAINKDAEANIIKRARYAVVGDWKKVLPGFIEKLKAM
jgi:electron transfer flavoprotein alpha subunit